MGKAAQPLFPYPPPQKTTPVAELAEAKLKWAQCLYPILNIFKMLETRSDKEKSFVDLWRK
jgi:hypothetical protein